MPAHPAPLAERIAAVRRFNRRHTRLVGALNEGLLESPFSLPQARVLYEIATAPGVSAAELTRTLGMDRGYLSRLVAGLEDERLVRREPTADNAKRLAMRLTAKGKAAFAKLDGASAAEVAELLGRLDDERQRGLVAAMETVENLLGSNADARTEPAAADEPARTVRLRGPVPGDLGWVVHRQAALYASEHGWDWRFEGLIAGIAGQFVERFDAASERCWIAERDARDGPEIVGSVFVVRESDAAAKLRMLYVEPSARGTGLGRRLVGECIAFARAKGYATLTLWTNDVLSAARRIYEREGFELIAEEAHHSFGHDLVGQHWSLELQASAPV